MIHPYSNETQTRWDRGDFKVQLNQPNNTRPGGSVMAQTPTSQRCKKWPRAKAPTRCASTKNCSSRVARSGHCTAAADFETAQISVTTSPGSPKVRATFFWREREFIQQLIDFIQATIMAADVTPADI